MKRCLLYLILPVTALAISVAMAQNVPQPFSPVPDAGASFKASYLAEYGLDYDGAIRPMTALIESDSRNYAASARLGWLHYLKGAHAESERHYKNAIRLVPTHFGAIAGMGHCFAQLGDLPLALRCYRRARRLNPQIDGINEAIDRLQAKIKDSSDSGVFDAMVH